MNPGNKAENFMLNFQFLSSLSYMQINTNAHMDCVTIFVIVVVDHSNKLIKASNSTL